MKKTTVQTILALFAMSSLAAAAPETATGKATERAGHKATTDTMMKAPAGIKAKVVSVDEATKTVTLSEMVKGADGAETAKEVKVTWNETTKLSFHAPMASATAKTMAATVADLKAGTEVMFKTAEGNPTLATEIAINHGDAAKPATEMPAGHPTTK